MSAKPLISLALTSFPIALQEYAPANLPAFCRNRSITEEGETSIQWEPIRTPSPYRPRGESHSWGDFVLDEEEAEEARMSPLQLAEKEEKKAVKDETLAEGHKDYLLRRLEQANVDAKTGSLKRHSGRCCRDAEEPAKWVVGKKRVGTYKEWIAADPKMTAKPPRPADVPPTAVFWGYGCEPHLKGSCPHLHPGQKGYEEAKRK
jgi:hypothetical protein